MFLEVDPWSHDGRLSASEADTLRASLRASGAAVLLQRSLDCATHRRGVEENALDTDGALAQCFTEAATLLVRRAQC